MKEGSQGRIRGLENRVQEFIRSRCALPPGIMVVVAVSGGADSVCLLHVLHRLSGALQVKVHVAHLDHMLRGADSKEDSDFVIVQAEALGLPCTVESRDVMAHRASRRCSVEEAAREVRYSFLRSVAQKVGADVVMTGHTTDDAVETVMLHILRGSGVHGLRGLEPVADFPLQSREASGPPTLRVVRPLLTVSREEAREYCRDVNLGFRDGASNESVTYLRNRIRLELLPIMRQLNPRFDDALLRLAGSAVEDDNHLWGAALEAWERTVTLCPDCVRIDLAEFIESSPAVQSRLILNTLMHLSGGVRDVSYEHVTAVLSLVWKSPGKQVDLPHGIVWRRGERDLTAFFRSAEPSTCRIEAPSMPVPLVVPGQTVMPGWLVTASYVERMDDDKGEPYVAYLDLPRTGEELFVRRRKPGDRFLPLGMSGEKKVQDLMVDARIPAGLRDSIPIVCSRSQIIWVVGWHIDERVKVTADTREVLRLEFAPRSL